MSLQVWLPLTKDLRQQGLANTSSFSLVSDNSLVNGGKVGGQCLVLTKLQTILENSSCMSNKKQISYAYWIKVNTAWSANWLDGIRWTSSNGTTNSVTRQEFYTNCTKIGIWFPSSSTNAISEKDFTPGVWTHLAATLDYSTGDVNFYINGVLQGHVTTLDTTYYCRGDFYIGDNGVDISMNDVRIYDHCLSPMEVKELAKGLVLHYPLNRQGWGQENLLPVSGSTIINSTQSFEFQGWVQNFYTKTWMNEHLTPGKQYTLSYTVTCLSIPDSTYTFKENRASPILVHQGGGWSQVTTTSDGIKDTNMSVGQSRDYKCTFIFATASETYEYYGLCGYTALYRNSSNNTQYAKFRIDNLKLEEGSIATPWCPNSSDALATTMGLNSTTEYDCSGFCNNGTRIGTFTWTSDTPKYQVSTVFTAEPNAISSVTNFSHLTTFTYSCWIKTNTAHNAFVLMGYQYGNNTSGSLALDSGTSKAGFHYYVYTGGQGDVTIGSNVNYYDNQWHMLTATYDGSKIITYFDGVKTAEGLVSLLTSSRTFSLNQPSGASGRYFKGQMNDARVYATALSATDVLALYQNSAYIDSSGNVYGAIHTEV